MLLPLWTEVGIDDALEMVGPEFEDARVRAFAVKHLAKADDEVRARAEPDCQYVDKVTFRNCFSTSCSSCRLSSLTRAPHC